MKRLLLALVALCFANVAHAQIINTLPYTFTNGTVADAAQVNSNFSQIVNNANANAAKNGINSDITALTALLTPISPVGGGSTSYYGTVGGTANAITVAVPTPNNFTLTAGYRVFIKASATNTGAATLSVSGTTATAIRRRTTAGTVALTGGEIVNGNVYELYYDGSIYQLMNTGQQLLGGTSTVASGSTTDLGALATHNAVITGTTTITSFGSTASAAEPIYFVTFSGALQLTYNATSMILPTAANITTAANDTAIVAYLGSGNWQVVFYQRANGQPVQQNITLNAPVTLTSTSTDITGIPAGVKRIQILLNGMSTNGTSNPLLQLGAGSVTSTGYVAASARAVGAASQGVSSTAGIPFSLAAASGTVTGIVTCQTSGSNVWICSFSTAETGTGGMVAGGGSVTLGGSLDRIRMTTVGGTDTFDAGTVAVTWEY